LTRISLIIPLKGRPPRPEEFYLSILQQTLKPDEVIIVYQGGFDEIFEKYVARIIRIIDARGTSGANLARNIGIKNASGDILIFTDSDVRLKEDWIENIVKLFEEYPDVNCIAGSMVSANPEAFLSKYLDFSIISPTRAAKVNLKVINIINRLLKSNIKVKIIDEKTLIENDIPLSTLIVTCNFAIKREIVNKVGFFDEEYKAYGSDDIDYAYRILKNGYKILCVPQLIVYHYHRNTITRLVKRYFQYGLGFSIFKRKHPESTFSRALNYMLLFLSSYFTLSIISILARFYLVGLTMILFSYSVLLLHNIIRHRKKLGAWEIISYAFLDLLLITVSCIGIIVGDIVSVVRRFLKNNSNAKLYI